MAGIYIHIPFCRRACHYCNFHFSTSMHLQNEFVHALLKEIELQQAYLSEPVSTIYFGGGTPSILSSYDVNRILNKLYTTFKIESDAEITLEANPDDLSSVKLNELKVTGVNRLSIGVQSFFDEDLAWMNRVHNSQQAIACIALAQQAGFNNITIDLIYGTPTLSDEHWQQNVQRAIEMNIPHLSCYALTVEPKTALETMIEQNKISNVETDKQARHFEMLMQWMSDAGYEHYEISNFAKPGFRSKHNSNYWRGKCYVGLGPSAHSFNGVSRQWNVANNALYIQSLHNNKIPYEIETLTPNQQLNEYIMTSLRTIEGLSLHKVKKDFGERIIQHLLTAANKHIEHEHLIKENEFLQTTAKGKLLADGIAADLFQL